MSYFNEITINPFYTVRSFMCVRNNKCVMLAAGIAVAVSISDYSILGLVALTCNIHTHLLQRFAYAIRQ